MCADDDLDAALRGSDQDLVLALAGTPQGIASFEILGTSMGVEVHASWDGCWLTLSPLLHRVTELSMEVERTYAACGAGSARPSFEDGADIVAVELLRGLDRVLFVHSEGSPTKAITKADALLTPSPSIADRRTSSRSTDRRRCHHDN
jgi:hypothetical protein